MASRSVYRPSLPDQVRMLREMTRFTGALHEVQVQNLKIWPFLLFEEVTHTSFQCNPEKQVVDIRIKVKKDAKKRRQSYWQDRTNILASWIQALLGDEWEMSLEVSGKTPKFFRPTGPADERLDHEDDSG